MHCEILNLHFIKTLIKRRKIFINIVIYIVLSWTVNYNNFLGQLILKIKLEAIGG